MLLAALQKIILEMRGSWARFSGTRTAAQVLDTGLSRADVLYPAIAVQIRADAVSMRTILAVASAAIHDGSTFEAARARDAPRLVLSAPILGFFEAALVVSIP